MPDAYDRITLLCRLKAAQTRNKELESGERYVRLKELHQKECREYGSRILELQKEAADAHKETIRVRNYWKICFWSLKKCRRKRNRSSRRWKSAP